MARAAGPSTDAATGKPPPDPATLIPSQRERRQRIVESALHLLERSEYEKIQMRDVTEEANVALGTVYRYFTSKEHLFAAVLVEWAGLLEQRVQRRPLKGDDPAARLEDMMSRVLGAFERWPQFFALIMVLQTTPDAHARDLYAQFAARTNDTFREALEALAPDDAQAVMEVANAVLFTLLSNWTQGMAMAEARRRMARSIQLVFSPPPALQG